MRTHLRLVQMIIAKCEPVTLPEIYIDNRLGLINARLSLM